MNKLSIMVALSAALLASPVIYADTAPKAAPVAVAKPAKADPDMQRVLDALASLGGKPVETLSAKEARTQPTPADAAKNVVAAKTKKPAEPEAVGKVEDVTYESGGQKIAARIYTPKAAAKGDRPIILYFRGGGWVIANLDVYDATPRALANATGAIVVSADYSVGPERKFPAAHDDAFAAYKWVRANAKSWGADPDRLAIAGESAGGNLAINTAIKARDMKEGAVAYMLLVYPVAGKDMTTPSYVANADAKPLNKPMMEWFVKNELPTPASAADPRIDLVNRTDLAGLPAATVVTAEIDPLRSEGQLLAANLTKAGVKVHAIDVKGVTHEFFGMGAAVPKAKTTLAASAKDVKAALAAKPKPTAAR